MNEARQFLDALFGGKSDEEYILVWLLAGQRSAWFADLAAAAEYVDQHRATDVYIGVALSPKDHGASLRLKIDGGERPPSGIVGLYADIDILDAAHKKRNLPPDEESARSILFTEAQPSVVIHSGGGLQAWWLFKEPWTLDTPEEIERAGALSKRWVRALRANAAAKGWDVDQVGDLTRILRVPGTSNCKVAGHKRPVVIREINDRRYNPSDLAEYLDLIGAARIETPRARGIVVGKLIYDPAADVDQARFGLLVAADPTFAQSWAHTRKKSFPDQSASAYDQALANVAAKAGWSDQDIANLMIAHRRRWNVDLKLRDTYYVTTIRRARELAGEAAVWEGIDNLLAEEDARQSAQSAEPGQQAAQAKPQPQQPGEPAARPQEAMTALEHVSQLLGIRIVQIYKYIGEEPAYRIKCGEGAEIELGGVSALTEQRVFRDRIAALMDYRIPSFERDEWPKISRLLLRSLTKVELGPEAKTDGMLRSWLDQYFEGLAIQDRIEDADDSKCPFWSQSLGRLCFYLPSFQRWCTSNHGADKLSTPAMLRAFKRMGIEQEGHHFGRKSSRSVYAMRSDYSPPQRPCNADAPSWVDGKPEDQDDAVVN